MGLAAQHGVQAPADPEPGPAQLTPGQRLLEVLPGLATWGVIIALVALPSLVYPLWVAIGIVLLDVYWLVRSILLVNGVVSTHRRIKQEMETEWWNACLGLPAAAWTDPDGQSFDPREVYHAALVPTYTERYEVLHQTLAALDAADYPPELKLVAIITRTTDEQGIENVKRLQRDFEGRFHAFWHILDPVLPGVVVGKSAAMAWGGPVLRRHVEAAGLDARRVIVTDLDSDFRLHPGYMARVTWEYVQDRDRDYRLYQPVPMFHNNIWRVPAAVHVLASATTQWQMFLHSRPYRLVTFASYSMSMQLVEDVGYWDPHVIQEDSRFFWRCFFRYGARLKVRPVCLPIYGDAPRSKTYTGTHQSQYNQIRRWAWGVSDIPFVFFNTITHPEIPLRLRLQRFGLLVFNHLTWVAMPLLLLFGASIPGYLATLSTVLRVNVPHVFDWSLNTMSTDLGLASSGILTVTLLNVAILIWVDESLVPHRPSEWSWWRRLKSRLEIILYPLIGLVFSVVPALESQTRLMFGFYLEYRVTEKE